MFSHLSWPTNNNGENMALHLSLGGGKRGRERILGIKFSPTTFCAIFLCFCFSKTRIMSSVVKRQWERLSCWTHYYLYLPYRRVQSKGCILFFACIVQEMCSSDATICRYGFDNSAWRCHESEQWRHLYQGRLLPPGDSFNLSYYTCASRQSKLISLDQALVGLSSCSDNRLWSGLWRL